MVILAMEELEQFVTMGCPQPQLSDVASAKPLLHLPGQNETLASALPHRAAEHRKR